MKKFKKKIKYKFLDEPGEGNLSISTFNFKEPCNKSWVEFRCVNKENYLHDHMFPIDKKTAKSLGKYFNKLSKELK